MTTTNDLFSPPTESWVRLSSRFIPLRRLDTALGWVLLTAIAVVPLWIFVGRTPGLTALGVGAVLTLWRVVRQGAIVRAWGYAERETDLYITSGIFQRQLTVVPYGRMQAVEVTAGPLQRAFNVATVKLVTASAQSDAMIPGLEPEAAAALRDRLTERGETQAAGL